MHNKNIWLILLIYWLYTLLLLMREIGHGFFRIPWHFFFDRQTWDVIADLSTTSNLPSRLQKKFLFHEENKRQFPIARCRIVALSATRDKVELSYVEQLDDLIISMLRGFWPLFLPFLYLEILGAAKFPNKYTDKKSYRQRPLHVFVWKLFKW